MQWPRDPIVSPARLFPPYFALHTDSLQRGGGEEEEEGENSLVYIDRFFGSLQECRQHQSDFFHHMLDDVIENCHMNL